MHKSKFKLIVLGLVFSVQALFGQTYQFRQYGVEEGLSHPFVYTINEDQNGFIWVGTGEGLCRFDGFEFRISEEDKALTNGFVTVSHLDNSGTLWFGHNSGQVTYYDGKDFKLLDTGDDITSAITDIKEDTLGNIFIAAQNNGLIRVNKNFDVDVFKTAFLGMIVHSVVPVNEKIFLMGTADGLILYVYENNEFEIKQTINELDYINVQTVHPGRKIGNYWIGTEDSGFFLLSAKDDSFNSYEIINMGEKYASGYINVQSIFEDTEDILWVSTFGQGIYKLVSKKNKAYEYSEVINYSTVNGLPYNFIKTIYQDWEGNHWIGTYGNGLAFSVDEAFTVRYQDIEALRGNILSLAESESDLWLGGENALVKINKNTNEHDVINASNGLPNDKIKALYYDQNKNLWIGTDANGIFQLNTKTNKVKDFYRSDNSMGNSINSISGDGNKIYVGSQNGVVVFDIKTGKREQFTTSEGLPHNDIKQVYIDSQGHQWLATKGNGIVALDTLLEYSIEGNGNLNFEFTSITEDAEGNIWAATYGDGVFKFEKDSIRHYYTDKGLRSNYCYSIVADNAGHIWVGHRFGLSSINIKTGGIKVYSKEIGIGGDCNYNAIMKRNSGVVLIGTTQGLVIYDSSKEKKKKFAPRLNLTDVLFSDQPVDFSEPIRLPYDIYKLKISYIGLNYANAEGVSYQYKLDGYDLEWNDITKEREADYPRIEDGDYTFMLKACNVDGECVEKPLLIVMIIRPPIWKTWWFITLSIIIGIGSIYWFIKNREKNQKALQEYLENELQARTKEVVKQKEQLEIKNRDITDSINYAQRIQQSILPSINSINENFSESFVYYKPRDIVSGDFYWYDRVNDDKFLIVCADSTGHGVPGAFMSMIGTTLIKDICLRKTIESPSEVLQMLDVELHRMLNQNVDAEKAHDGMDIVVCEIDVNTHYMRFASAMRPMILYKDKKLQYVKGTKASIGGELNTDKRFENTGFQLSKGDIIYMFSDGYPDQFGGPRGKKFKMDRVKNMLADVCDKVMEEQQAYIKKTFDEWTGKLQQVDDVLFMGVRI